LKLTLAGPRYGARFRPHFSLARCQLDKGYDAPTSSPDETRPPVRVLQSAQTCNYGKLTARRKMPGSPSGEQRVQPAYPRDCITALRWRWVAASPFKVPRLHKNIGERGNNKRPARPTSGGCVARKSPTWAGSWLAYGEIRRNSADGARGFRARR
jgi:hypothetical protein